MGRSSPSFGDVFVDALRAQIREEYPSELRNVGRLLEDPTALRRMVTELRELRPKFTKVWVPTYHWHEAMQLQGCKNVHPDRDFLRFAPEYCPRRHRLYGPRQVRLTFVCLAREVTLAEARQGIGERGLRPAHPIEGFMLAQRRPDFLLGPAPITTVGRTLGPARHLPADVARTFPRVLLTFSSAQGRPITYLEMANQTLPAHHLLLAALP